MNSENNLGLVHVITGTGKGKTTSALGLALRAVGHGLKVYIIQFMKGEDTGEIFAIKKYVPNITIVPYGRMALKEQQTKFFHYDGKGADKPIGPPGGKYYYFPPDDKEEEPSRRAMEHAFHVVNSGEFNVVILDEVNCVLDKSIVPMEALFKLINEKPKNVELILTGRGAPKELMERADYVNEVNGIKHPYDRGILARKGIEY
ncbi:cob(I)yrinic acid a,c-diamide adenosyltransferase [archaeon]|nr:cob(I)yrinic acid a,c-diamide adenosyltransferase [archaeon]